MAPRSQSTRDMLRQEAKIQEMQEEVRRREIRGLGPQQLYQQQQQVSRPQVCFISSFLLIFW